MTDRFFFGYGSLVNVGTHAHAPAFPARIAGWRRVWRHLPERPFATLSVEPFEAGQISGLIAGVNAGDWAALDEREAAYGRHDVTHAVTHNGTGAREIAMYVVPADTAPLMRTLPILLSYLDVVVQGYHQVFGGEGVADFLRTTAGWEAGYVDDRAEPIYPRHQVLTAEERRLSDQLIAGLTAHVQ
jgi:hypothetical protein